MEDLGITLLLSPQETRRRDRAARGIIVEPKKPKSRSSKMTKPNGEKLSVERVENIGEEAEDWIRRQSVGKQKVRAFVGHGRKHGVRHRFVFMKWMVLTLTYTR